MNEPTETVIVRGFKNQQLLWEERLVMIEPEMDCLLETLAMEHVAAMQAGTLGVVEIEFLDEPDPEQRFFRIGVEPEGMVMPIRIDLKKGGKPN